MLWFPPQAYRRQQMRDGIGKYKGAMIAGSCEEYKERSFVERAFYTYSGLVQDMRVDHGRGHVGMAEQFLNRASCRVSPLI